MGDILDHLIDFTARGLDSLGASHRRTCALEQVHIQSICATRSR